MPSPANPPTSGRTVPSKLRPIRVPSASESKVVREPTAAEATPAMWPSGSSAMALRLPNRMPLQKNATPR